MAKRQVWPVRAKEPDKVYPPAHSVEPSGRTPILWRSARVYNIFEVRMVASERYFRSKEEADRDAEQANQGRMATCFYVDPVYLE